MIAVPRAFAPGGRVFEAKTIPMESTREVYFEITGVGTAVKVSAIDPKTGIEVSIMGPSTANEGHLQQLALQKLKKRLADAKP